MNTLRYFWLLWKIQYYRAALNHLDASHPDVPEITLELMRLNDDLYRLRTLMHGGRK